MEVGVSFITRIRGYIGRFTKQILNSKQPCNHWESWLLKVVSDIHSPGISKYSYVEYTWTISNIK